MLKGAARMTSVGIFFPIVKSLSCKGIIKSENKAARDLILSPVAYHKEYLYFIYLFE